MYKLKQIEEALELLDRYDGDKGNIIFNNLGKITFTSFGYSSLNSSSFPFIL